MGEEKEFTVKSKEPGESKGYTQPSIGKIIIVVGLFTALMLALFMPDKNYSFYNLLSYLSNAPNIDMSRIISTTTSFFDGFPQWLSWLATPLSTVSNVLLFLVQSVANVFTFAIYFFRYFWVA